MEQLAILIQMQPLLSICRVWWYFVTEFHAAAVLMLDPATKAWGGSLQLPHGVRILISVTKSGMTVLGSDPTVCKDGRVSSMPAVEEVCAKLL